MIKILTVIALVLGLNLAVQAEKNVEGNVVTTLTSSEGVKFNSFMNSKAKNFVTKNNTDWKTFTSVVALYNTSISKFMTLSDEEKQNFITASNNINAKLSKMRRKEAKEWLKKLNATSSIYKFVWNNKVVFNGIEDMSEAPQMAAQPSI